MSADLFAEFSAPPASQQPPHTAGRGQTKAQPGPSFSFFDDLGGTEAPAPGPIPQENSQQSFAGFQNGEFGKSEVGAEDESDGWGEFEGGTSGFESAQAAAPVSALPLKHDPFAFPIPNISQPNASNWLSNPVQNDAFAFSAPTPPTSGPPSQIAWSATSTLNDPFGIPGPQTSQPSQTVWPSGSARNDPFGFGAAEPTPSSQESWTRAPVVKAKKSADPSVLFDAEDDFDDDDFGDFEGTAERDVTAAAPSGPGEAADLFGALNVSARPTAPRTFSGKKSPTSGFGSVAREKELKAGSPPPSTKQGESWDTFDDWEASIPSKAREEHSSKPKGSSISVPPKSSNTPPQVLSPTSDDPRPGELPPTNVPPPAVLLTLFPALFTEAQTKLFKPMAAQTLPMRNKLLSEPATIAYLQGYMMLASVAAQIIAGRKLRWKRDQHLSQGMRIGPASSRATSGMKLSTVDKSENMKEEREALDVVRAWKDQVGRLRHVVSAANQIKAGTLGVVPDIQEMMPVKVLRQGEGGVPAPQACMLCGLKRDERVGAVDQGVEDSFGEWWVEQVNMHRGMIDPAPFCHRWKKSED